MRQVRSTAGTRRSPSVDGATGPSIGAIPANSSASSGSPCRAGRCRARPASRSAGACAARPGGRASPPRPRAPACASASNSSGSRKSTRSRRSSTDPPSRSWSASGWSCRPASGLRASRTAARPCAVHARALSRRARGVAGGDRAEAGRSHLKLRAGPSVRLPESIRLRWRLDRLAGASAMGSREPSGRGGGRRLRLRLRLRRAKALQRRTGTRSRIFALHAGDAPHPAPRCPARAGPPRRAPGRARPAGARASRWPAGLARSGPRPACRAAPGPCAARLRR